MQVGTFSKSLPKRQHYCIGHCTDMGGSVQLRYDPDSSIHGVGDQLRHLGCRVHLGGGVGSVPTGSFIKINRDETIIKCLQR